MFQKLLIANRGEIACRILRTCKALGIPSVAIYSEADSNAPHVRDADEAYLIGPAPVAQSYLNAEKIIELARAVGADAIHPGYGLLSENLDFARNCEAAGITFVGPAPEHIDKFGLKHTAREIAAACGVPLLTGTGLLESAAQAAQIASQIGYPVMLKSTAGGGGIGMCVCRGADELEAAFEQIEHLSLANFGQSAIYLEKFVEHARHIEVQIFGDGRGKVVTLGERDCSTQRRNQKVIEETPAPGISQALRTELALAAQKLAQAVSYRSAGTVEFLVDAGSEDFYFLEVNTRLQVEHGVTEEVTGIDLVAWMLQLAAGTGPDLDAPVSHSGHAIQVRLYAEDPRKNFQPSSGVLTAASFPPQVRCDSWIAAGTEVTPHYDPLLSKVIVRAATREQAVAAMAEALAGSSVHGIETNLEYLFAIIGSDTFAAGKVTTAFLKNFSYQTHAIDVLAPGAFTSVQDYPGRLGYWDIGVPPSGPMDHLAFRMANTLAGNAESAPALEITLSGPTLRFNRDTRISLCGAPMHAELDGAPAPFWQTMLARAGSVLKIGALKGAGCRAYLAIEGGLDVPEYLGSKSTFVLGQFGGHGGRTLLAGDVLRACKTAHASSTANAPAASSANTAQSLPLHKVAAENIPQYSRQHTIRVTYGPHGAPDFFTRQDMEQFFATAWEVHYNSARTGIRLIGPKPQWARSDGGQAGLHPSNLHDTPYAIGAVNFTGDMPIILGPDGPSLGGFVCPVTIIHADFWRVGQLSPGDTIRFVPVAQEEANRLEAEQDTFIATCAGTDAFTPAAPALLAVADVLDAGCVCAELTEEENAVAVKYRSAGDKYLLIEYGPLELDLSLRLRIHALMQWLTNAGLPGLIDVTPGVRSLQLHYDSRQITLCSLVRRLLAAERTLPAAETMSVPSRVVHLPMAWNDSSVKLAIEKYSQSVRKDAPWNPSNVEFIRRINGLGSVEEVCRSVFETSYLVMGLGDVYLGAPAATPIDPRHRLLTTKYNPARTWTAEGTVGIGGVYMCIYGMDSPGGYQLVGRTLPIWNRYGHNDAFKDGKPWLLRFFDQVRYFEVSETELEQIRADFRRGNYALRIEQEEFSLSTYNRFLADNAASIAAFQERQQKAFVAERERWEAMGQTEDTQDWDAPVAAADEDAPPAGQTALTSHIAGNVWKVPVRDGQHVQEGEPLVVLEAMKMEIAVLAPASGIVHAVKVSEGKPVKVGQPLIFFEESPALVSIAQSSD